MGKQRLNIFIVDDDPKVISGLQKFLEDRFSNDANISTFLRADNAVNAVDSHTDIVVLDYKMEGINGDNVIKQIKKNNPRTEVMILSTNESVAVAIDSYWKGATSIGVKGVNEKEKISELILDVLTFPIRLIVREFGVSKFVAIFLMTFITIGLVVLAAMFIYREG